MTTTAAPGGEAGTTDATTTVATTSTPTSEPSSEPTSQPTSVSCHLFVMLAWCTLNYCSVSTSRLYSNLQYNVMQISSPLVSYPCSILHLRGTMMYLEHQIPTTSIFTTTTTSTTTSTCQNPTPPCNSGARSCCPGKFPLLIFI